MNGDLLLNVDFPNFISASSLCTNSLIGSFEVEDPTRFGVLEVGQNDKVVQFVEKPKDKSYGNKISLVYTICIEKIYWKYVKILKYLVPLKGRFFQ